MKCSFCGEQGHQYRNCPKWHEYLSLPSTPYNPPPPYIQHPYKQPKSQSRKRLRLVNSSPSKFEKEQEETIERIKRMKESNEHFKKQQTLPIPPPPSPPSLLTPLAPKLPFDVTKAGPFNNEAEFRAHQKWSRDRVERIKQHNALENSPADLSIPSLSTPSRSVPPTRGKKGYPSSSWVFNNKLKGGKTRKNKRKGGTKGSADTLMNWATPKNNKKFYIPRKSNLSPQLPPLTPPSTSSPMSPMSPRELGNFYKGGTPTDLINNLMRAPNTGIQNLPSPPSQSQLTRTQRPSPSPPPPFQSVEQPPLMALPLSVTSNYVAQIPETTISDEEFNKLHPGVSKRPSKAARTRKRKELRKESIGRMRDKARTQKNLKVI